MVRDDREPTLVTEDYVAAGPVEMDVGRGVRRPVVSGVLAVLVLIVGATSFLGLQSRIAQLGEEVAELTRAVEEPRVEAARLRELEAELAALERRLALTAPVPDVVGLHHELAVVAIRAAGFLPVFGRETLPSAGGVVVSEQRPPAGERATLGERVHLILAAAEP